MLAVPRCSGMGCNPLTLMEDFNCAGGEAHPELLFDQLVRHRVIMPFNINVVINPGAPQFPFRMAQFTNRMGSWYVRFKSEG